MADPGDLNLKHLSGSTDGVPIVIAGTAVGSPTLVHEHPGGATELDLVTLILCNTHSADLDVGVVVYTGTPADPTNIVSFMTLPAKSGAWIALDRHPVGNAKKVGVYCATASKITAFGRVARATL